MPMKELQKHEDTGWINVNNVLLYRKLNKIVYLYIFNAAYTYPGWKNIYYLPQEYRPTTNVCSTIVLNDINPLPGSILIRTDGSVELLGCKTGEYLGFVSYPVD